MSGHGTTVLNYLSHFSDGVDFNLYRVTQSVGPDGKPLAYSGHICNAIFKSIDRHDVDVINISLGSDHSENGDGCQTYRQPCKLRESAQDAMDHNIPVCAAAGNQTYSDNMLCPAYEQDVISVGAVSLKNEARLQLDNPVSLGRTRNPPKAGFFEYSDEENTEIFCTGRDCVPSPNFDCQDCRKVDVWDGNVEQNANIYAPHRKADITEEGKPKFITGTSWSTPIVTAGVSEAIRGLKSTGVEVDPAQIRRLVYESGEPIDGGNRRMIDMRNLVEMTADENGLGYEEVGRGQDVGLFDDESLRSI